MLPSDPGIEKSPLSVLPGVGPAISELLGKLGLLVVGDLWFHLPLRYQDRTRIQPIAALISGSGAQVEGEVQFSEVRFSGRRALNVVISDGSGLLKLRFFHFNAAQQLAFAPGVRLRVFGDARVSLAGMEMVHPQYRVVAVDTPLDGALTPVYPATEGLNQQRLLKLVGQALDRLPVDGDLEQLPAHIREQFNLPSLREALLLVHRPQPDADLEALLERRHPAQRRLAFDELIAHQLAMRLNRRRLQQHCAPVCAAGSELVRQLRRSLPFQLTAAQRRVCTDISADLALGKPMLRLLQGDVGSGKTVVAALAAAQAIAAGYQVAVMAPTELLAEQHLRTFSRWYEHLQISPVWLAGKVQGQRRAAALHAVANGTPLVIGTHAVMQEHVKFQRLGLAIIDEQHRFGVDQRLSLRDKGASGDGVPHQLVMTATPIPRTLAMVAYADLDVSVIDELPPGRSPIHTVAIDGQRRAEVVERIRAACLAGRQAYWVCTLIDESDQLQAQAAEQTSLQLREALPELQIGLVHGRMKARDKQAMMDAFAGNRLNVLIATTVIEVGVDVPNASLMIIENAERLGLSQLHQLRGRVGRGAVQSACVLMYQAPLGQLARERIRILRESQDGFRIAQADLEQRGPGEFLGTRQAGFASFRVADLSRDQDQLPAVREAAELLLDCAPAAVLALIRRWVGVAERFAEA
jgi:ATP-dependent DNA helicase RecG